MTFMTRRGVSASKVDRFPSGCSVPSGNDSAGHSTGKDSESPAQDKASEVFEVAFVATVATTLDGRAKVSSNDAACGGPSPDLEHSFRASRQRWRPRSRHADTNTYTLHGTALVCGVAHQIIAEDRP